MDADPPVISAIGLVEDIGVTRHDRHFPADLDIVDVGIGHGDLGGIVRYRIVDDMQLQALDTAIPLGPVDQLAQRDRRGIDQPDHLVAFPPQGSAGQSRQLGEGLGEDRQRAAGVGIGERRARQLADPQVIMMVGVGIPSRLQPAQAPDPAKLGADQHQQMLPAAERLVVGIAGMTIHKPIEPTTRDRLEKVAKNAIAVAHARSCFLSLDNQKVAGSSSKERACTRDISNLPRTALRHTGEEKSGARHFSFRISSNTSLAVNRPSRTDGQADIAAEMQQRLGQLVLGPALVARHAQMDGELRPARLGGCRK